MSDPLAAHRLLLDAAATLATLARPDRDLLEIGTSFAELALTLKCIGAGLDHAYEVAGDRRDALARRWGIDRANTAYQQDIAQARGTAIRTAKRALIDLAALINEIECQQTEAQR